MVLFFSVLAWVFLTDIELGMLFVGGDISMGRISVLHWNCFAMTAGRSAELAEWLSTNGPDLVALNEVKLCDALANERLRYPGYSTIYRARKVNPRYGGGVCLLVREGLDFERSLMFDGLDVEILSVDLRFEGRTVQIVCYYNPPDSILERKVFGMLEERGGDFVLCGDLNAKSLCIGCKKVNASGVVLEGVLADYKGVVINDRSPTYFRDNVAYCEVLDLFIASPMLATRLGSFEVLEGSCMGSDHLPVVAVFGVGDRSEPVSGGGVDARVFMYECADWGLFRSSLDGSLDGAMQSSDVDLLNGQLVRKMIQAAEVSIPKKSRVNCAVCLPKAIIDKIKDRRRLRRELRRNGGNGALKCEINKLKKEIDNGIRNLKQKQWNNFLDGLGRNKASSGRFWNRINRFRSPKSCKAMPTLVKGNVTYDDDVSKASVFASLLSEDFSKDRDSDSFDDSHRLRIEEELRGLPSRPSSFDRMTVDELRAALKALKVRSAPGPDGVHNLMLKNMSTRFLRLVLGLFNLCLEKGETPRDWKLSKICMIPKKDKDRRDPGNYRPISLTSCLCKLFERVVRERIVGFLESRGLLQVNQSGFRPGRRTSDNLFFLTQKVRESFARGKRVCGLLFDIRKAFDRVWHDGLIHKLMRMGVPEYLTLWIRSFLDDRRFLVSVGKVLSDEGRVETGVPQGAVLSPVLFLVFINDVPSRNVMNTAYSMLFADDLCLFYVFRRPGHVRVQVQKYLDELEKWLFKWRLKVAVEKSSYSVFSKSSKSSVIFDFSLNGKVVPRVANPVYLGVTFDERLNFSKQVGVIRDRCLRRLGVIKVLSHSSWKLGSKLLVSIYRALIGSIIDYSFFLLSVVSGSSLKSLQAIQNRAMKCIFRLPFDTRTSVVCGLSGLIMVEERLLELNKRFIAGAMVSNPFVGQLLAEYRSAMGVYGDGDSGLTPLCPLRTVFLS